MPRSCSQILMSIFGRGAHQGRAVAIAGRAMAMLLVLVVVSAGLEDARFVAAQKLDGRGEQFPKVGGRLTKLYQSHLDSTASESGGEGVTQGESVDMPGDGYVVIDAVADSDAAALLSDLEKLGLTSGERYGSVVSGWLPIEAIGAVSGLGELRFARESVAVTNTGSVENQADVATRADAARSRPSPCARSGSFHIFGSSSSRLTSTSRSDFLSKSKIPPERMGAIL